MKNEIVLIKKTKQEKRDERNHFALIGFIGWWTVVGMGYLFYSIPEFTGASPLENLILTFGEVIFSLGCLLFPMIFCWLFALLLQRDYKTKEKQI